MERKSASGALRPAPGPMFLFVSAAVFVVVCLSLIPRQGLWTDEIFSLAIATGHSLEHPAHMADAEKGDFVEPRGAVSVEVFRQYTELGDPAASLARVSRAVLLSDTNPPLYYWMLNLWCRIAGTGDFSLRLLSVLFGVAAIPFLWLLAQQWRSKTASNLSILLYSISPVAVYYSTDGRMYSLLWLISCVYALVLLRIQRVGWKFSTAIALVLTGVTGLLTHYYFIFPWVALFLWAVRFNGKLPRRIWAALALVTILLVLPWYALMVESLNHWRITQDWLKGRLPMRQALAAPLLLVWGLLSPTAPWERFPLAEFVSGIAIASLVIFSVLRFRRKETNSDKAAGPSSGSSLWPWIWLASVCLGPSVQDLVSGTHTASITRYAVGALPAALLIVSRSIARLPILKRVFCLVLLIVSYVAGVWKIYVTPYRSHDYFPEAGAVTASMVQSEDLVLIHSIPSAVLGVTRYLNASFSVACWIDQLGQKKVPDDIRRLISNRKRIAVLRVHKMEDDKEPEVDWLKANADLIEGRGGRGYHILVFENWRLNFEVSPHGEKETKKPSAPFLDLTDARPSVDRNRFEDRLGSTGRFKEILHVH